MTGTDHINEDDVLRRMLNTPHESHKPLRERPKKDEEKKR